MAVDVMTQEKPMATGQAEHVERDTVNSTNDGSRRRMTAAGIVLGLGLGGFFDGIVIHQVLQWHHMLTSAGFPPNSVENLQINTLWDGLFHALTWVLTVAGVFLLWRAYASGERPGSLASFIGLLLIGWGLFNLVEGLINHYLLGIHHVRDDLPPGMEQQLWDIGFLLWGAAMILVGWLLARRPRRAYTEGRI